MPFVWINNDQLLVSVFIVCFIEFKAILNWFLICKESKFFYKGIYKFFVTCDFFFEKFFINLFLIIKCGGFYFYQMYNE